MSQISAKWKRYNANSRDKDVGDCVKRSLSYAYGVDYDEISRQLNRIKREVNGVAFNTSKVYTKFLRDNGASSINVNAYPVMTEEEFSKKWNQGVYICLTGPENKTYSTHMVCIMNGDIIDSWDSSDYVVRSAWEINNVSLDTSEVWWEDVEEALNPFIDKYINTATKKYSDWFKTWRTTSYKVDNTTYKMEFFTKTSKDISDNSVFYPDQVYIKRITVKLNPRMSTEKNIESLKPKLKQKVYDWIYQFQKDKRDCEGLEKLEVNEDFEGWLSDKKNLLKLPAWCRPYVTRFKYETPSSWSIYPYELIMKALPDDPYVDSRGKEVEFFADSLRELKDYLERYKNFYERYSYDY